MSLKRKKTLGEGRRRHCLTRRPWPIRSRPGLDKELPDPLNEFSTALMRWVFSLSKARLAMVKAKGATQTLTDRKADCWPWLQPHFNMLFRWWQNVEFPDKLVLQEETEVSKEEERNSIILSGSASLPHTEVGSRNAQITLLIQLDIYFSRYNFFHFHSLNLCKNHSTFYTGRK